MNYFIYTNSNNNEYCFCFNNNDKNLDEIKLEKIEKEKLYINIKEKLRK